MLLLVAGDPRFNLARVTVTPGTYAQVAVVQTVLAMLGRSDTPVGAEDWPRRAGNRRKKVCDFAKKLGGENEVGQEKIHDTATLLSTVCDRSCYNRSRASGRGCSPG